MSQNTSAKLLDGVFAINKPPAISSAQVLRDLQTHFDSSTLFAPFLARERTLRSEQHARYRARRWKGSQKGPIKVKLGHGGTLDPLATGVLIVGVGKGTKQLQRFLECTKTYECVVLFGAATDTYDTVGKVVAKKEYAHVTEERVREALKDFRGKIMQRPPIYSALKMQGKKLYEYAREGKELPVEIKDRAVEVLELECVEWFDGGKHEWRWPTEEAPSEEKTVVEKLGVVETAGAADTEPSPGSLKRKREDDDGVEERSEVVTNDSSTLESPSIKRQKEDNTSETEAPPEEAPLPTPASGPASVSATTNGTVIEAPADITPATPALMSGALASFPTPPAASSAAPPTESHAPPAVRLRMTVTSGFYVRSLCHDLGQALGSAACMAALVRTRQAGFALGGASNEVMAENAQGDATLAEGVTGGVETAEGNVLDYDDLERGEDVWAPRVEGLLRAWRRDEKAGGKDGAEDDDEEELGAGARDDVKNERHAERDSKRELNDDRHHDKDRDRNRNVDRNRDQDDRRRDHRDRDHRDRDHHERSHRDREHRDKDHRDRGHRDREHRDGDRSDKDHRRDRDDLRDRL